MPHYIVSGRNEAGRTVTQMVKTATTQDALDVMRGRGFSDLVLLTDDIAAAMIRVHPQNLKLAPAELLKQGRLSAVGRLLRVLPRFLLICGGGACAIAILFFAAASVEGNVDWLLLLALAFLPLVLGGGPLLFKWYNGALRWERLERALALGRWETALRLTARVGSLPAAELAARRAAALAGSGRLDEALDLIDEYADEPKWPEWLYWMYRADVLTFGGNQDECIASLRQAMRHSPLNATVMLVLAVKLLRHRKDTTAARELFQCAVESGVAENIRYLVYQVQGLIAAHENDLQRACETLTKSLAELAPRTSAPLIRMIDAGIRGQLAATHAKLGERDAAELEFQTAEPFLRVHRFFDVIVKEYQDAMAET
jgi:tetratricopeptide (TPR) repeat protein